MCTSHQTRANQIADRVLNFDFAGKIDMWRWSDPFSVADFEKSRAAQSVTDLADENDFVARILEPLSRDVFFLLDQTDHADGRRRIDHSGRAFII